MTEDERSLLLAIAEMLLNDVTSDEYDPHARDMVKMYYESIKEEFHRSSQK